MQKSRDIELIIADEKIKEKWARETLWDFKTIQNHMHLENGFSLVAKAKEKLAGMISVYWKKYPV